MTSVQWILQSHTIAQFQKEINSFLQKFSMVSMEFSNLHMSSLNVCLTPLIVWWSLLFSNGRFYYITTVFIVCLWKKWPDVLSCERNFSIRSEIVLLLISFVCLTELSVVHRRVLTSHISFILSWLLSLGFIGISFVLFLLSSLVKIFLKVSFRRRLTKSKYLELLLDLFYSATLDWQ